MNDADKARYWTTFLATREDAPESARLLEHFDAGTVTESAIAGATAMTWKFQRIPVCGH